MPLSRKFLSKSSVEFCQNNFCTYRDDHMVFILKFVNGVYNTDWFTNIEISLHAWDKSHWIRVYDPFSVLLNLVFYCFVENVCTYTHQWYCTIIFFFCGVFFCFFLGGGSFFWVMVPSLLICFSLWIFCAKMLCVKFSHYYCVNVDFSFNDW